MTDRSMAAAMVSAGLQLVDEADTAVLRVTRGGAFGRPDTEAGVLPPGARIGRYVILERVGSGGMGAVYAAFDPELDRRVALKILHPEGEHEGSVMGSARIRMQREAQAMARVSHPNVISVFDVGAFEDAVFVAMEFVEGPTLRRWLEQKPRTSDEIVALFVQAGTGLAAAHAAGLVHRDFKPDNVLVTPLGAPGEHLVRVLDFGLARTEASLTAGDDDVTPIVPIDVLSSQLTHAGAIVGTPRYMAPEQHAGVAADARCDQFGFCVALYEALYRRDPFVASTTESLAIAKLAGNVQPIPSDSRVPAWLGAIVLRGLAVDPNDRWPDMRTLVERLARDPAVTRRKRVRVAAIASLVGGVAAGVASLVRADDPCSDAAHELAGVWDDARRTEVRDAMLAVDMPYAANTAATVTNALDAYADEWIATRTEACTATLVRHERSPSLLDREVACLGARRQALAATVDMLAGADAATLRHAHESTRSLPTIASCDNPDYLLATLEPPPDAFAAEVLEVRQLLQHARALENSRPHDASTHADTAYERALAIDYPPLVAEVLVRRGSIADLLGDYDRAQHLLFDGLAIALGDGHDEAAAEAAERLVAVIGIQLAHYDEGLRWARVARSLHTKLDVDADPGRGIDMTEANVFYRMGEYRRAGESYEHAIAAIEASRGPDDPLLVAQLTNLGNVLIREARPADALAAYARAEEIARTEHGDAHPLVAVAISGAAHASAELGRAEDAEAKTIAAREVFAASLGDDHPNVVALDCNLGLFQEGRGDYQRSLETFARCHAAQARTYAKDHPEIARVLCNLGRVRMQAGDLVRAREELTRGLAIQRAALGDDHDAVASTLEVLGELELRARAPATARTRFAESLATFERSGTARAEIGRVRFAWARASRLADGPSATARAAAIRARDEVATAGATASPVLAEIDAWLTD
ncbi:MAG TPA: serine/threonine-protein kinase [Nannocystaceae bacterium]|nr:serine/threonine-protein kinase [Nannocystaceae bacterium]